MISEVSDHTHYCRVLMMYTYSYSYFKTVMLSRTRLEIERFHMKIYEGLLDNNTMIAAKSNG